MAIIEVVPEEVRYWLSTGGCISRGVQEVASAVQGKVTVPGELRTLTKEEVSTSVDNLSHAFTDHGPQIQLAQGAGAISK